MERVLVMKNKMTKKFIKNPAKSLSHNFEFNPVLKITSRDPEKISDSIRESPKATNTPQDFILGETAYLNSRTRGCTPLQAYLLEFNSGYKRL